MTSTHTSDAIVIGGGIVAQAIAYELTNSGTQTSLIYSKEESCRKAASLAAGAMLGAYGEITLDDVSVSSKRELEFRIRSQQKYPDWLDKLREQSGESIFTSFGTFLIGNHLGPQDHANLEKIKQEAFAHEEPCEWVDPANVPGLRPSAHLIPYRCLFLPREGSVDTADLLAALETSLIRSDYFRHVDEQVVEIQPSQIEAEWKVVTKGQESYFTKCLIICAGSQTTNLLGEAICAEAETSQVYFGKGTSVTLESDLAIPHVIRTPNRAFACGIHVLPRSKGLYVGATNLFGTDHDAEEGIDPGELHMLFDQSIHQINTDIRKAKIKEMKYGFRPIAVNRRPLIGKTKLPGLYVATGTYRNGVLMAPLIAELVHAEVTGKALHNPLQPNANSIANDEAKSIEELTKLGARDIVSMILEPGGSLPYDRARELEQLLATLLQLSLISDHRLDTLKGVIKEKMQSIPLAETMDRVYVDLFKFQELHSTSQYGAIIEIESLSDSASEAVQQRTVAKEKTKISI
jgi:glycine/D-amino acid oxidase-like deaminating enzyme